jgi:hypothetical protein
LRALLEEQRIASLGTLHAGEPYVSMVPFAIVPRARFVIHVSTLAAHTRDMLQDARVSLMIVAQPRGDVAPQGLGRVTLQGDATRIEPEDSRHAAVKAAYLARFPDSEPMFDFSDFSLFEIVPRAVRFVGGFAQARSLTPDTFAAVLHDGHSIGSRSRSTTPRMMRRRSRVNGGKKSFESIGVVDRSTARSWENARKPNKPCALPMPDSFTPPKGSPPWANCSTQWLMQAPPELVRRRTCRASSRDSLKTYRASGLGRALICAITASRSS